MSNTDVQIQSGDVEYKPAGNAIEVAMINFLSDYQFDVRECIKQRNLQHRGVANFPFDQKLKMKTWCRKINEDTVRVVTKGAPEYVLTKCTNVVNITSADENDELTDDHRQGILANRVSEEMAK